MSDYKYKKRARPIFGAIEALREEEPEIKRFDAEPMLTYKQPKSLGGIQDIVNASREKRFTSPFIHQPEKKEALDVIDQITQEKPTIWKNIPNEVKKRIEQRKEVFDAPTSRQIDPVTKKVLEYTLAPAEGFAYGMQHAGDLAEESKEAFKTGDYAGGITGSLASLLRGGFSAATPILPVLSGFATGSKMMSDVIGEEKMENIFTPITKVTQPESLFERSATEIGDLGLQLLFAKGIHSAIKGGKSQRIGEGFVDESATILREAIKDYKIKPRETKRVEGLTQEKLPVDLAKKELTVDQKSLEKSLSEIKKSETSLRSIKKMVESEGAKFEGIDSSGNIQITGKETGLTRSVNIKDATPETIKRIVGEVNKGEKSRPLEPATKEEIKTAFDKAKKEKVSKATDEVKPIKKSEIKPTEKVDKPEVIKTETKIDKKVDLEKLTQIQKNAPRGADKVRIIFEDGKKATVGLKDLDVLKGFEDKIKSTEYLKGSEVITVGKKNFHDALKDKIEYDVKLIANETGKTAREVKKIFKDLEYKGLIRKEGNNYKPTDEMGALLNDIKTNPKKYGEDIGKLYSNPIPALVKGYDLISKGFDNWWQKMIGDKAFKKLEDTWMKVLPEKVKEQIITNHNRPFEWTEIKRETRIAIDRYNELAGELFRNLTQKTTKEKFSPAEQVRLQQIIRGSISKNDLLRQRADKAIQEIKSLGELGKELEVLPIETYNTKLPRKRINQLLTEKAELVKKAETSEGIRKTRLEEQINDLDRKIKDNFKYGGEGYFKRAYATKEQERKFAKYGVRPYKLDLTSAIRRQDIPWEIRKEMGEILQAGYPVAKGIKLLGRDVAIGKMFEKVAENPEWATMVERPGFIQLPKDKKLGKLSEKFVEEKIANDILDIIEFTKPEYLNSVLKDILTTWKATKTVMNPATHGRNIMSESIMADFGGISHMKQLQLTPKAIELLKGKGERHAEWKLSGLQRTTFAEAELGRFLDTRQGKKVFEGNVGEMIARVYGKASLVDTKIGETMRKYYQLENEFFKAIHFLNAREKGMTIAEARNQANKWGMDYGEVPRLVEKMRTNPFIGMPFITWSFKALPRIIEAAMTRPVTFWKYPLLFGAITDYSLKKFGLTEEEWDEIKSSLPDRIAKGMWMLIPFRDKAGKMQMLDLTYTLPYKDAYDIMVSAYSLAKSGVTSDDNDIISAGIGMVQAPITQLMAEISLNKSSYTGSKIYSEADEPTERLAKILDHMYKSFMPPLAPEVPGISEGGYSYHKLRSVISEREDYYGRSFSLAPAIGSSFLGIKTSPIEPEKNLQRKSYKMQSQISELGAKRNRVLRDNSLEQEKRLEKASEIERKINNIKKEKEIIDKKITPDEDVIVLDRRLRRLQSRLGRTKEPALRENLQKEINKIKIEISKLTQ